MKWGAVESGATKERRKRRRWRRKRSRSRRRRKGEEEEEEEEDEEEEEGKEEEEAITVLYSAVQCSRVDRVGGRRNGMRWARRSCLVRTVRVVVLS